MMARPQRMNDSDGASSSESGSGWGWVWGTGLAVIGGVGLALYGVYEYNRSKERKNSSEERQRAILNQPTRPSERENSTPFLSMTSSYHNRGREMYYSSINTTIEKIARAYHNKMIHKIRDGLSNEKLVETLKSNVNQLSGTEKIMKWREIMVNSFSKMTALAYNECFVVGVLRLQMNFLGGKLYKDNNIASQIQQRYLELLDGFLGNPLQKLISYFRCKTAETLSSRSLDDFLTKKDILDIFRHVHSLINIDDKSPLNHLQPYVLSESTQARLKNAFPDNRYMKSFLNGLADRIGDPYFNSTMKQCIKANLIFITEQIMGPYPVSSSERVPKSGPGVQREMMMKLIPRIDELIEHPEKHGFTDLLLKKTLEDNNLKTLSDDVYEVVS